MDPTTIAVSIITALVSLIGTALGAYGGQKLTAFRIQELEKKVDRHNNFAARMPVVEEQIKVANHRISDLENKNRKG